MPHVCYVEIFGCKQQEITSDCCGEKSLGQSQQEGHPKESLVLAVKHNIIYPRDPLSGQPSGQRLHQPLTVTKLIDKASPLINTAMCQGERLDKVVLSWYRISDTGGSELYYKTTLENAIIVNIETYMPNSLDPAYNSIKHMEEVSFSYEKITWNHEIAGTSGSDSWRKPEVA